MDPDLLTPRSPPSSRVVGKWVVRGRDSIVLGGRPQAALASSGFMVQGSQYKGEQSAVSPRMP